jgi:hypothetical protein
MIYGYGMHSMVYRGRTMILVFYTDLIFLTYLCKVKPQKLITHLTDTITTWVTI